MAKYEENIIYYGYIEHIILSFYIAVTKKGLCFVGSTEGSIEELKNWQNKYRSESKLVHNLEKVSHAANELIAYLDREQTVFNLQVDVNGTEFQKAVWNALEDIPYGITESYTDIAIKIGKPSSVRAVGTAIGANPILIVIPCHRVLAKSGKLSGYRGGIVMKEILLQLESN